MIGLLKYMTIQDVSAYLGLGWGTIKQIDREYLEKHYSKPRLKEVEYVAIDEFAVRKGHVYQTVVYDLLGQRVIFVGEGRASDCLDPFWTRLKASGAMVKAVAMDMWPAYISAVSEHLPEAEIVFDRFHITKKVNEALDEVRKSMYREEEELGLRKVIKGTRWILLANNENVDSKKQKALLNEALSMNKPLSEAYYLKEDLRQLWCQRTYSAAKSYLTAWLKRAWGTCSKAIHKLANTIAAHRTGILNWFIYPISTGPLEGINNKIKVLKRKAYGYRDTSYFKLKILALHETKYALL